MINVAITCVGAEIAKNWHAMPAISASVMYKVACNCGKMKNDGDNKNSMVMLLALVANSFDALMVNKCVYLARSMFLRLFVKKAILGHNE